MSSDENTLTTVQLRRAVAGDMESLGWIVERFTPLLTAQAHFRLSRALDGLYDADDLVQDVWAIVIPRLNDLESRLGRLTPTLVNFLGSTLYRRYAELLRKQARRGAHASTEDLATLPAETSDVVRRASRSEIATCIADAIDSLSDEERSVLILRALEHQSNAEVAEALSLRPEHVAVRYHRARTRLASRLEQRLLDELELP